MEVLALTDGGRDFGAKGGGVLCNKRRGHVMRKVVPSTWKKYYKYEKIQGVPMMSTTVDNKRNTLNYTTESLEKCLLAIEHLEWVIGMSHSGGK